jgi:hypothetical protein
MQSWRTKQANIGSFEHRTCSVIVTYNNKISGKDILRLRYVSGASFNWLSTVLEASVKPRLLSCRRSANVILQAALLPPSQKMQYYLNGKFKFLHTYSSKSQLLLEVWKGGLVKAEISRSRIGCRRMNCTQIT